MIISKDLKTTHMKTEIISKDKIQKAAKFIQKGLIVAFPTETVYGLGANALNPDAVNLIFLVKKRPQQNPLIVHVENIKQIQELVICIPESAKSLMKKFTPGPLTFILPKNEKISNKITGGLNTVAIRIPKNKIALKLIKLSQVPIVAPSANISKRPSSTSFQMVEESLSGLIHAIIKTDKPCEIGIESTVIGFDDNDNIKILRPGIITKKQMEKVLKHKYKVEYSLDDNEKIKSPGNLFEHYKPNIPVYLFTRSSKLKKYINRQTKILITKNTCEYFKLQVSDDIKIFNTLEEYAKNIYKEFIDSEKAKIYKIILCEFLEEDELGLSINNRLKKASNTQFTR